MNRMNIFQAFRSGRFSALVALVGLGLLVTASGAKAGGIPYKAAADLPIAFLSPHGAQELNPTATIVGLWYVTSPATPSVPPPFPPAFQLLQSYKTWHTDGTEVENAFLNPAIGNIYFGVWEDLGNGQVRLHQIGLVMIGAVSYIFTVDETDTVAPNGNSYTGSFNYKLFPATDVLGTGTPSAEVTGTTAGTRITVD